MRDARDIARRVIERGETHRAPSINDAIALAEFVLLVEKVLTECWCDAPGLPVDRHSNATIEAIRRRLGWSEDWLKEIAKSMEERP